MDDLIVKIAVLEQKTNSISDALNQLALHQLEASKDLAAFNARLDVQDEKYKTISTQLVGLLSKMDALNAKLDDVGKLPLKFYGILVLLVAGGSAAMPVIKALLGAG